MLTATSPSLPAASRATRINSPCALCNAPIVGTSTRRFTRGFACASATVLKIFTSAASLNSVGSRIAKSTITTAKKRREDASALPKLRENGQRSWTISRAVLWSAMRPRIAFVSNALNDSEKQDEHTGDHQREHPDQINVDPRAAQYRNTNPFVNHNRDQCSR